MNSKLGLLTFWKFKVDLSLDLLVYFFKIKIDVFEWFSITNFVPNFITTLYEIKYNLLIMFVRTHVLIRFYQF